MDLAKGVAKAVCLQYRLLEFVILTTIYRPLVYPLSEEGSKGMLCQVGIRYATLLKETKR